MPATYNAVAINLLKISWSAKDAGENNYFTSHILLWTEHKASSFQIQYSYAYRKYTYRTFNIGSYSSEFSLILRVIYLLHSVYREL